MVHEGMNNLAYSNSDFKIQQYAHYQVDIRMRFISVSFDNKKNVN